MQELFRRCGLVGEATELEPRLVLDPLDLIARLVALIPPPPFHMVRYLDN